MSARPSTGSELMVAPRVAPAIMHDGGICVFWTTRPVPEPGDVRFAVVPAGMTIVEIVRRVLALDPAMDGSFLATGSVTINGHELAPKHWPRFRPRPFAADRRRVKVGLHPGVEGGGNTNSKLVQVATLAASFLLLQPEIGLAALGTQSAVNAAVFGVNVTGALIARSLAASPGSSRNSLAASSVSTTLGRAGASGNVLQPDATAPRPTGKRRYAPPFWINPYAEIAGDDEFVELLYVMAGPMTWDKPRLGDIALADLADCQFQFGEGKPGDPPLTLINRYSGTDQLGITASRHNVDPDDGLVLVNQLTPDKSCPAFHPFAGRDAPAGGADEIVALIEWNGGLISFDSPNAVFAQPMRVAFRPAGGDAWTFGPEIHWNGGKGRPMRKYLKLKFASPPVFTSQAPTNDGPSAAYKLVPAQTIEPARPGWQADDYFSGGAGGDVMTQATFGAHNVRNVLLEADGATLYLDPAKFPPGAYEIKVIFGATYNTSSFVAATYTLEGTVYDLFGYYLDGATQSFRIPAKRNNIRDDVSISRVSSIWNKTPIPLPDGVAFAAIRIKNQQVSEFTAEVAGLVPLWNGSEWTGLSETRNPAPHVRKRLADQYPAAMIGDAALLDWQQFCADKGYETCAILGDESLQDGINKMAAAGRARLRQSEVWDVLVDRDTSTEMPVQTVSLRNVGSDVSITNDVPERSAGLLITFDDAARGWKQNHVIVRNPFNTDLSLPLDTMSNDSDDDAARVAARGLFDILQYELRSAKINFTMPMLGIRFQRGDVVALSFDLLSPIAGGARIREILLNDAGKVSGLKLDGTILVPASLAWSNAAAAWSNYDAAFAASRIGVAIRLKNRGEIQAEIVATGEEANEITFVTPFDPPIGLAEDCHVISGALGEEYVRGKIFSANSKGNGEFGLTAVYEANEIHAPA
jgi:hypothetical protein